MATAKKTRAKAAKLDVKALSKELGANVKEGKITAARGRYYVTVGATKREIPVGDLNPEADVKAFAGLTVPVIVAGRSIIAIGDLKWKRPPILCYIPAPDIFKQIRPDLRAKLIDRYVDVGAIPGQLGEQLLQRFG